MDKTTAFIEKARAKHGATYDYSGVQYVNKSTKVRIACPSHGGFDQTPNNHLNGQGCPQCAKDARATASRSRAVGIDEFIRRATSVHGSVYDYSRAVYKDQNTLVAIVCPVHGEFTQGAKVHTSGHGCPQCAIAKTSGVVKDSARTMELFKAKYPELDFSGAQYTGRSGDITARCPTHGLITKPASHWRVSGCPHCGRERGTAAPKATAHLLDMNEQKRAAYEARFRRHLQERADWIDANAMRYVDQATPVQLRCKKHGQTFWPTPKNMIDKDTGCSLCGDEKVSVRKLTRGGAFLARAREAHGDLYDYTRAIYTGAHEKVEILCAKHGAFWMTPHSHTGQKPQGCPQCGQKSSGEAELFSALQAAGIKAEARNRKVLAPKEIDIYLPEQKIGIEFHGLYWHTEDKVGNLHRQKWELAQEAGVRLVQVFGDEWLHKRALVLGKILSLVGVGAQTDARKCQVTQPATNKVRAFLEENHIQGAGSYHKEAYALEQGGEIVALMTFGPARTGGMTAAAGSPDWELLRYATNQRVRGGFTRLLAAFRRQHTEGKVISYCDLRWGDGRTYGKAGFVLESISNPDYYWLPSNNSGVRVPRYQTQKHKVKNHPVLGAYYTEGMTEKEVCAAAGWKRILGVGNQKWVLDLASAKASC